MAISDKVIELETVHKGRNIVFIVLVAVLAAASITFGVLWALKKPAVDPPRIETIKVGASDLFLAGEKEDGSYSYKVSRNNEYTINFDFALPEDTTLEQVNSLLEITCEPMGYVTVITDKTGLDSQIKQRYNYTFRVNSKAESGDILRLTATSVYTPDVSHTVELTVVEQNTEYLELTEVSQQNNSLQFVKQDNQYTLATELPYFTGSLADRNDRMYTVRFDQLGALDKNNAYAKVTRGVLGQDGHYTDEMEVMICDEGSDKWYEIGGNNNNIIAMSMDSYIRSELQFMPRRAGTSTIRLRANAYNASEHKPEIYLTVTFTDAGETDKITEIEFRDPMTGKKADSFEIFLGETTGSNPFSLPEYIWVTKKGETIKATELWGMGKLQAQACDSNGNFSAAQLTVHSSQYTLYPNDNKKATTGFVRVYDSGGYGASLLLKVNVVPPVTAAQLEYRGQKNDISTSSTTGAEISTNLTYTIDNASQNASAVKKRLTFTYNVADAEDPSAVCYPVYKDGKLTNADKVIALDRAVDPKNNATTSAATEYRFDPDLTLKGTALVDTLLFRVGKDVQNGVYTFRFAMQSQSIVNPDRVTYFTVRFEVTKTATTFQMDYDYDFSSCRNENDRFSSLEKISSSADLETVKLRIAVGSKIEKTDYSLYDLVRFYDGNAVIEGDNAANKKLLKVKDTNTLIDDEDYRFFASRAVGGGYSLDVTFENAAQQVTTVRLFIEYFRPLIGLNITDNESATYSREIVYSGKTSVNTRSSILDGLTQYTYNNTVLPTAELHPLYVNIIITPPDGTTEVMLKKVRTDSDYYFFDVGYVFTDAQNNYRGDIENALFKCAVSGAAITDIEILRDLFAYSYDKVTGGGIVYDRFRVVYSFDEIIPDARGDFAMPASLAVKSAEYRAVRQLDNITFFKDGTYTTPLTQNELTVIHNSTFDIFASGIIRLPDGTTYTNALPENLSYNLLTQSLSAPEVVEGKDYLHYDAATGRFTAECEFGTDRTSRVQYKFSGGSVYITVNVSNRAVPITDIVILGAEGTTIDAIDLYTANAQGYATSAALDFTVTYDEISSVHTRLEEFYLVCPDGIKAEITKPLFTQFEELTGSNYLGTLTVSAADTVRYGQYVLQIVAQSGKKIASITVNVATPLQSVTVTAGGKEFTPSMTDSSVTLTMYNADTDTLRFSFRYIAASSQLAIDHSTVTAQATLKNGTGLTGKEEQDGDGRLGAYVISANGRTNNASVEFTFTQSLPDGKSVSFVVTVKIEVVVPVHEVTLVANGDTLPVQIVTAGGATAHKIPLSYRVNGIAEGEQGPTTPQKEFSVRYLITDKDGNELQNVPREYFDIREEDGKWYLFVQDSYLAHTSYYIAAQADNVRSAPLAVNLTTSVLEIAFADTSLASGKMKVFDFDEYDLSVKITNKADSTIVIVPQDGELVYSQPTRQSGDATAKIENGKFSITGGSSGKFTVSVTYTDTRNDNRIYPLTLSVSYFALVDSIKAENAATGEVYSDSLVEIVKGESLALRVTMLSDLNVPPYSQALEITNNNADLSVVDNGDGTLTVTGNAVGTMAITLSVRNAENPNAVRPEKTIAFKVVYPDIVITRDDDKSTIDFAKAGDSIVFTPSVPGYNVSFTVKVTALDGSETDRFALTPVTGGAYRLTCAVGAGDITANDFGEYRVTVSTRLQNIELNTAEFAFAFICSYVPGFAVTQGTDLTDHSELRIPGNPYTVQITNLPEGWSVVNPTVEYLFDTEGVSADGNGVLQGLRMGKLGITARITAFGRTFESAKKNYTIVDMSSVTTLLYVSDTNDFAISNGVVTSGGQTLQSLHNGQSIEMDYTSAADAKYLLAVADYTDAVGAATVTAQDVNFNAPAFLTPVGEKQVGAEGDTKKSCYQVYRLDNFGTAVFNAVNVRIDGKAVVAASVSVTLTAQAPEFADGDKGYFDPGDEVELSAYAKNSSTREGKFKGTVTYDFTVEEGASLVNTLHPDADSTDNEATASLSVLTGKGGGRVAVRVDATVTSGAYKGLVATRYFGFTVNSYALPSVTGGTVRNLTPDSGAVDLARLVTVQFDADDTSAAYAVKFAEMDGSTGKVDANNLYTLPETDYTGLNISLPFTVTITKGYWKGYTGTIAGSVRLTSAPRLTLAVSQPSVLPFGSVTLSEQVFSIAEGDGYTLRYSVDAAYGSIEGNRFTAAQKYGKAEITAHVVITDGIFAGAVLESSIYVDVMALTLAYDTMPLTAKPGEGLDIAPLFRCGTSATTAADTFTVTLPEGAPLAYNAAAKTITPHRFANFTGENLVYAVQVTVTKDGKTYYGVFDFTVSPRPMPTLTAVYTLDNMTQNGAISMSQNDTLQIAFTLAGDGIEYTDDITFLSANMSEAKGVLNVAAGYKSATFTATATATQLTLSFRAEIDGITVVFTHTSPQITIVEPDSNAFTVVNDFSELAPGAMLTADLRASSSVQYVSSVTVNLSSLAASVQKAELYLKQSGNWVLKGTVNGGRSQQITLNNYDSVILQLRVYAPNAPTAMQVNIPLTIRYALNSEYYYRTAYASVSFRTISTSVEDNLTLSASASAVRAGESISVRYALTGGYTTAKAEYSANSAILQEQSLRAGKIELKNPDALSAVTAVQVTVTLSAGGKTEISKSITVHFVPKNSVRIDGTAQSILVVSDTPYTLTLQKDLGNEYPVTFTAANAFNSISGNRYTAVSSGSDTITAAYEVEGVTFTDSFSFTVIETPALSVTEQTVSGGKAYTVAKVDNVPDDKYELTANETLVSVSKTVTAAGVVFTVTGKPVAQDTVVPLEFKITVTGGIYNGLVLKEVRYLTLTAVQKPVFAGITAQNGQFTAAFEDYSGKVSYSYGDLTAVEKYFTNLPNADGAFTLAADSGSPAPATIILSVTVTLSDAPYAGIAYTATVQLTLPASPKPDIHLTVDTSVATGTVGTDFANASYVYIVTQGSAAFAVNADGSYTITPQSEATAVTLVAYATVGEGHAYAGEVLTVTLQFTVPAKPI